MNKKPTILVVDDDPTVCALFSTALKAGFTVKTAANGDEALTLLTQESVDVILLDVSMPGMDGYTTCRRIKEDSRTTPVPVVFVSTMDTIPDRLKGYEAGAEDYIVKPFDMTEVIAKLTHLLKVIEEHQSLRQRADMANTTAMTAMTNLSEFGTLINITRSFGECGNNMQLADAIMAGIAQYGLTGIAQVRGIDKTITRSNRGKATPIESSILEHMAQENDRIVEFKSRLSINYEHVSLLVYDMPTDDPDRCGRLRDHLAMLMENVEARFMVVQQEVAIHAATSRLSNMLESIDRMQKQHANETRLAIEKLSQRLTQAYASVALSTQQEDLLNEIVNQGIAELIDTSTDNTQIQLMIAKLISELNQSTT